jgi:hypothetical protein
VGYQTETFNSATVGSATGELQPWNFYGETTSSAAYSQNADGGTNIPGSNAPNSFNATLSTAAYNASKPGGFQGVAFGGGALIRYTFQITSGTPSGSEETPSVWGGSIEPTTGALSQTDGASWVEVDIECNLASATKVGLAIHNWYNAGGSNQESNAPDLGAVTLPASATLNESNTFDILWVPATDTSEGYIKFFINDVQVASTWSWVKYQSNQAFPPTGNLIGNVLDTQHFQPIIGNSQSATPMQITSVQVWQASGGANIVN